MSLHAISTDLIELVFNVFLQLSGPLGNFLTALS